MDGQSILVIKLGALGDFIQALGPMAAIRWHHPDQKITLLTSSLYAPLARASRLVDHVQLDSRPRGFQIGKWLALRRFLKNGNFGRVYDLQTSDRSSWYYRLFFPGPNPEWSGIAAGCSHPHVNPERDFMHTVDRQREQLNMAGIDDVPAADVSFANADLSAFNLPGKFALLVPGGAPHRPAKRWPTDHFRALAHILANKGLTPVVIGTKDEAGLAGDILDDIEDGIDLTGKTDLLTLVTLAGQATLAIGNDTGPMHIMAAARCPSTVLFSDRSDPKLCAPRGDNVNVLLSPELADLAVEEVAQVLGFA